MKCKELNICWFCYKSVSFSEFLVSIRRFCVSILNMDETVCVWSFSRGTKTSVPYVKLQLYVSSV
jgi:hypothetical protein